VPESADKATAADCKFDDATVHVILCDALFEKRALERSANLEVHVGFEHDVDDHGLDSLFQPGEGNVVKCDELVVCYLIAIFD
jgi:hypothetical protein